MSVWKRYLCGTGALLIAFAANAAATGRPNILFIIADDLNCYIGSYGHPLARTPHIDRLAARGVRFDRAYCTYPVCGPSRNSLLTGLYPNSTGIFFNQQVFRQTIPEHTSLPQALRLDGYLTARIGKLYHYNVPGSIGTDGHDDPASWEFKINPLGVDRIEEEALTVKFPAEHRTGLMSWYASPKSDEHHTDGKIALAAGSFLDTWAGRENRPFFLGVGFFRPHMPYIAPRTPYFDHYPEQNMPVIRGIEKDQADIPQAALASYNRGFDQLTDDLRRQALQAYLASVSFLDEQVGRVLDALDRSGLGDNTIIVFTSDHGYHRGEHGLWRKSTLFEVSARVPLIVVAPGRAVAGAVVTSPVSQIDLYPTLAELAQVEPPTNLPGQSLVPMLADPTIAGRGWALTQVGRERGHSLRTPRWRYTEWDEGASGRELYDHSRDPDELTNLAADPAYAGIVAQLADQLRLAVRSTFPETGLVPKLQEGLWPPVYSTPQAAP